MRQILNQKTFQAFRQRCASCGAHVVHVQKRTTRRGVELHYNARDPRSRKTLTAVWVAGRGADAESSEKAFHELAAAEFVVHKRYGEAGDAGAAKTAASSVADAAPRTT